MVVEESLAPTLAQLLESQQWQGCTVNLPLAVGSTANGQPLIVSLTDLPHLFITGCTGSGKTVCVDGILVSLLQRHGPDQLQFLLIDPNQIDLHIYSKLPHLICPVIVDSESALIALNSMIKDMEHRLSLFAKVGVRNIDGFNSRANESTARLPHRVLVISDLCALIQRTPEPLLAALVHICSKGRGVGLHLVVATQPIRPKLFDEIKMNIPARLCFRITNGQDSIVYLDEKGAEKLQGPGAFIYRYGGQIEFGHSAFVSEADIQSVVTFWMELAKTATANELIAVDGKTSTLVLRREDALPSTEPAEPNTTASI